MAWDTAKGMPIMCPVPIGGEPLEPVPWDFIAPHEYWAWANHGQSLVNLAERGGLAPCEVLAILEDRPFTTVGDDEALHRMAALLKADNVKLARERYTN